MELLRRLRPLLRRRLFIVASLERFNPELRRFVFFNRRLGISHPASDKSRHETDKAHHDEAFWGPRKYGHKRCSS